MILVDKHNRWMRYFTMLVRFALAFGFFTAGMVKIMGERFAGGLSVNHPMGHYLEALSHTGYYYPFIGIMQVVAAILLIIPRTALLGALLYFPIIFNICILSWAVRFEGSLITSPLMALANLYLLCWDYERLKLIFTRPKRTAITSNKFPYFFFGGVLTVMAMVMLATQVFELMPRNSLKDCETQCSGSKNPEACKVFCNCIHTKGQPLDRCLDDYTKAVRKTP